MLFVLILAGTSSAAAQDIKGGTVIYQQTTRYDFQSVFGKFDNPEADEWVASLPRKNQSVKFLHFTQEKALFLQDPDEQEISNRILQEALQKADYFRPPQTLLLQVYSDFTTNEAVRQVEFMTRYFLISGPVKKWTWKLTQKMIKVQGYTCMAAELRQDQDIITAYFTPEIPVSTGPAEFSGLPGLILALEINGETAFLATSVDLTPPDAGVLAPPDKGRKMTQEEFNRVLEEKVKEWEKTRFEGKGGNRKK
jgi:GLPGLI family protein